MTQAQQLWHPACAEYGYSITRHIELAARLTTAVQETTTYNIHPPFARLRAFSGLWK